jgi:uncharacterized protein (TIGR02145 family)
MRYKFITSVVFVILPAFLFLQGCQDNIILPETVNHLQAPRLLYPPNDTIITDSRLILVWSSIRDATNYHMQIATDSLFENIKDDKDEITSVRTLVENLKYSTKYFWRVNATKQNEVSVWSRVGTFYIASLYPMIPLDSDFVQPDYITFLWRHFDAPPSVLYDVYLDLKNPPSIKVSSNQQESYWGMVFLGQGTTYYWRIVAKAPNDTIYGPTWRFTTLFLTCLDIPSIIYEGKTYNTIQIGHQCWLRENLDVGTMIKGNDEQRNNSIIEKYCYNNSIENCDKYGGLYQWNEAMQYSTTEGAQGICPTGWHIPTYSEFQTLSTAVGSNGNALKLIGVGTDSGVGTNTSGFSGLLAGALHASGFFTHLRYTTTFWSSVDYDSVNGNYMGMVCNNDSIYLSYNYKKSGYSIRCIKD